MLFQLLSWSNSGGPRDHINKMFHSGSEAQYLGAYQKSWFARSLWSYIACAIAYTLYHMPCTTFYLGPKYCAVGSLCLSSFLGPGQPRLDLSSTTSRRSGRRSSRRRARHLHRDGKTLELQVTGQHWQGGENCPGP